MLNLKEIVHQSSQSCVGAMTMSEYWMLPVSAIIFLTTFTALCTLHVSVSNPPLRVTTTYMKEITLNRTMRERNSVAVSIELEHITLVIDEREIMRVKRSVWIRLTC